MSGLLTRFVPSVDGPTNPIRGLWDRLSALPGGRKVFSHLAGRAAPYTGTIGAKVVEVRKGFAKVEMRDRRDLRNHLRSIHAVALVNLAELTGNIGVAYSLPDDARFIVAGISIEYVKKARGTITGTSEFEPPATSERKEYEIEVVMSDESGDVVARAKLRTLVGPKKRAA